MREALDIMNDGAVRSATGRSSVMERIRSVMSSLTTTAILSSLVILGVANYIVPDIVCVIDSAEKREAFSGALPSASSHDIVVSGVSVHIVDAGDTTDERVRASVNDVVSWGMQRAIVGGHEEDSSTVSEEVGSVLDDFDLFEEIFEGDTRFWSVSANNLVVRSEFPMNESMTDSISSSLNALPSYLTARLRDEGWEITVVDTYDLAHGEKEGYSTLGLCYGTENRIELANDVDIGATVLHEIGHALDNSTGRPSWTDEWKNAQEAILAAKARYDSFVETSEGTLFDGLVGARALKGICYKESDSERFAETFEKYFYMPEELFAECPTAFIYMATTFGMPDGMIGEAGDDQSVSERVEALEVAAERFASNPVVVSTSDKAMEDNEVTALDDFDAMLSNLELMRFLLSGGAVDLIDTK